MRDRYTIAALSDIHANMQAFAAVMDDAEKHGADAIIVAGDHVGDGPDPAAVVDALRSMDAHIIRGNREEYIADHHAGLSPHWEGSVQMLPLKWTYDRLGPERIRWLTGLPEQKVIRAPGASIRIVHGSPRKTNELIHRQNIGLIRDALASVPEDIIVCGHCHQQYHMALDKTLVVNPGALGLPFIEPGFAPYTLLIHENGAWSAQERKVEYDLAAYQKRFGETGLLDCGPWVRAVLASQQSGRVVTITFLEHAMAYAKAQGWNGRGVIPNELYLAAAGTFEWERYELSGG